jgi:flagellar basal body-associated protein FliL
MNQVLLALAFQEAADDSQMWIILAIVLVILFFIVVIVAVGLVIFFVMRKRSKALKASAPDAPLSTGPGASDYAGMSQPVEGKEQPIPTWTPSTSDHAGMSQPEPAQVPPEPEPAYISEQPATATTLEDAPQGSGGGATEPFDPSRTVAIIRENTVAISYGTIKFVSGVLAGQQFDVEPEGSFVGRDSTLSQIVVADPRISKRHLWIGVRDGIVKVVDQDSRNGTFINDPKSERITEADLNSGDTVIMGESDVARFEYQL